MLSLINNSGEQTNILRMINDHHPTSVFERLQVNEAPPKYESVIDVISNPNSMIRWFIEA